MHVFRLVIFIISCVFSCIQSQTQQQNQPLTYNSIVTIESASYPGNFIWTYGASPYASANAKAPHDHAELLVGPKTDLRQKMGYQFFIFKERGNPANTGPIDYGDDIEIFSTAGGYGEQGLAGIYNPLKKWWVNDGASGAPGITMSRHNQASLYDIVVSNPNHPQTKDGSQIFKILSPQNFEGHVYVNDPVAFVSQGPRDCFNRRLWIYPDSRIGKQFYEILVSPPTDQRVLSHGIFKIHKIDKNTLSPEVTAMYNEALSDTLTSPGGRTFTFIPGAHGNKNAVYHPAWKFDKQGTGWISFSARAKADIYINLSSQMRDIPGSMYQLIIGTNNNTKTVIKKDPKSLQAVFENKDPKAVITGGIGNGTGDGTVWQDYWIKYDNGLLTFGKGFPVGTGTLFTWTDRSPNKTIQYVGLGGDAYLVDFKDISFKDETTTLNLPKGFSSEGEGAAEVAVGSKRNGVIEAWIIGDEDSALYRYQPNSMAANAWIKINAKDQYGNPIQTFNSVAASSDGVSGAVSSLGQAYIFDEKNNYWIEIPARNATAIKFSKLAIGNEDNIWALEKDTGIAYQLVKDKQIKMGDGSLVITVHDWEPRLKDCIDIACGFDNTTIAINNKNQVLRYDNKTWTEMVGVKLSKITVGNSDVIWGTFKNEIPNPATKTTLTTFEIWQYINRAWKKAVGEDGKDAIGFDAIDANAAGSVFALDPDGDIYNNGDRGVELTLTQQAVKPTVPGQPVIKPPKPIKTIVPARSVSPRAIAKEEGKIPVIKTRVKKRVKVKLVRKLKIPLKAPIAGKTAIVPAPISIPITIPQTLPTQKQPTPPVQPKKLPTPVKK